MSHARQGTLLVALGCGRLPGILDIAASHPIVVFGTMQGEVLSGLPAHRTGSKAPGSTVYFYESG